MIKGDSEKIKRDHFDIFKIYTKFYFLSEGGPKLLSVIVIPIHRDILFYSSNIIVWIHSFNDKCIE